MKTNNQPKWHMGGQAAVNVPAGINQREYLQALKLQHHSIKSLYWTNIDNVQYVILECDSVTRFKYYELKLQHQIIRLLYWLCIDNVQNWHIRINNAFEVLWIERSIHPYPEGRGNSERVYDINNGRLSTVERLNHGPESLQFASHIFARKLSV